MKYKKIVGGGQKEAEKKFLWLKDANLNNAIIDIQRDYPVWKNGIWKAGLWEGEWWENGIWENGIWKDGIWKAGWWEGGCWKNGLWKGGYWKGGCWENGTWESGSMWNNRLQQYEKIKQVDGKFRIITGDISNEDCKEISG